MAGLFVPFFYISKFAVSISSSHSSAFALSVLNAGGVLGRIAPAYISDSVGHFNILFPSALISGLLCLLLWMFSTNVASVMSFAVLYGFFSGSFISVITPCVAQISDMKEIGTNIGLLYSLISFPYVHTPPTSQTVFHPLHRALVGGPVAGALLSHHEGLYTNVAAFSGATTLLGSLFILASRLTIDSRILTKV